MPDDIDAAVAKYGGQIASPQSSDVDAAIAKYGGSVNGPPPQSNLSKVAHGFYDTTIGPIVDTAKKVTGWDEPPPKSAKEAFTSGAFDVLRPAKTAAGMLGQAIRAQAQQGTRAVQDLQGAWKQAQQGTYSDAAKMAASGFMHGRTALDPGSFGSGPLVNDIGDTAIGNQTPGQPPDPNKADPARAIGMAGGLAASVVGPKVARMAEGAIAPALKTGARNLYLSAMKASTLLDQPARAKLFQTAQLEGIPVSEGGLELAGKKIDALQQQVQNTIQNAPAGTQPISKFDITRRLNDTYNTFSKQATPRTDLNTISNTGNEFLEDQPNQLSLPEAQAKKIGTYNILRRKGAYGEQSAAGDEAQKALARGLKEELQKRLPELQSLNANEGSLLQLEGALQKAVARIQNINKVPLRAMVGGAMGGLGIGAHGGALEGAGLAGMGALLAYVIDDPFVKSRLAIALGRAADSMAAASSRPASVGAAAIPVGAYAGQMPPPGEKQQ